MTDRDRLIELFKELDKDFSITCPNCNTDKGCRGCKYQMSGALLDCNYLERKVDYLLSNGVIVPPCKVGDKVYSVGVFTGQVIPTVVIGIDYTANDMFLHLDNSTFVSVVHQLGKTVFLTEDGAEQKLTEVMCGG